MFFAVLLIACRNIADQDVVTKIESAPTETAVLEPSPEPTKPPEPTETPAPITQGDYLGQEPPGDIPQIFAPDIVSKPDHFEHSSVYFTPDLNQIFWISDYNSNPDNRELFYVTHENGEWTDPQTATFSEHFAAASISFSPDGNRLYFSSARPLTTGGEAKQESDIWFVDRIDDGWSEPVHMGSGLNSDNEEQLGIVLENGTIYYHDFYNIYRSEMIDGEYQQPEKFSYPINTDEMDLEPYVPDDESYILFSSTRSGGYGGADIYISYKKRDGNWGELINLGGNINSRGNDRMPIISPDGKYLFFFRVLSNASSVYWVDAQIIEELRPDDIDAATTSLEAEIILQKAQEFPALATYNIGLGDLDGDDDLDAIFVNRQSYKSRVWINDGLGNFEQTDQELTTQGHGVGLDDFDGDGDLDAVIVCISDDSPKPTIIYFNNGSGNFTDAIELDDQELDGGEVNIIDIENDGDMDIHVYYYPGKNVVYLNDGDGNFSNNIELMRGTIGWGDLNSDGSIDIFVKDHENEKVYQTFLNDGTGEFTKLWQMHDPNIAERKILLGDFDADGDLDAFTTNGERDQQHPSIVFFNNGDGTFEDSGQILGVTHMAHPIQGDLNGDGFLDIFIANGWMYDQILINDGHGFFADSGLVLDENLHSTLPSLGDLDMDGDLDIMVGSYESKPDYWFNDTNSSVTAVSNLYLGQAPPEDTPEIFAPGFVSTDEGSEYSSTFSPDGTEFYFTRVATSGEHFVFVTELEDGQWTIPALAPFNGDPDFDGSEALITPDGERLFFMSRRPLPGEAEPYTRPNMWMTERVANSWAAPEFFGADMMYVTQAANETIYFTDISRNTRYFIASQTLSGEDGADSQEIAIPELGRGSYGHPFIAPDGSYLIFNSIPYDDNMDLFVTFKMEDGTWSEPQNFGETINTDGVEFAGMVTPDGRYFFFTRSNANNNEPADIYWVSADIIETLRP
ncbi:MAG: hypothetical protein GY805_05170 [Chloroflexi bacterium]|nr:hypothetical protein [Chloroflexota bacterium]